MKDIKPDDLVEFVGCSFTGMVFAGRVKEINIDQTILVDIMHENGMLYEQVIFPGDILNKVRMVV